MEPIAIPILIKVECKEKAPVETPIAWETG